MFINKHKFSPRCQEDSQSMFAHLTYKQKFFIAWVFAMISDGFFLAATTIATITRIIIPSVDITTNIKMLSLYAVNIVNQVYAASSTLDCDSVKDGNYASEPHQAHAHETKLNTRRAIEMISRKRISICLVANLELKILSSMHKIKKLLRADTISLANYSIIKMPI